MNDLKLFNFENHEVRTLLMDGEPYFVGKDVAEILGYSNSSKAVMVHVDVEDKESLMLEAHSQNGNLVKTQTTVINESGVYALIFGSKLPSAKKFKHWVTSEVLPQIRKTGNYKMPGTYAEALRELADQTEKNEALRLENKEMKPKALFADAVNDSDTDILVGDLAKLIKQNGHDIGQKRLFQWMRDNGYLMKSGNSRNLPTQKAMQLGLFRIKERTINNPDGSIRITKTTKVTGKGQIYFVNKFIKGD
ncbi:phage antirepressor KilAC domain-containing protein [Faecalicoccus acidiformans]|uniref:phage antirepressor KilAC domain-containing protein n=1 Tax=Faecalicoccus acidiformans TaxID=915173 RepID=UPI0025A381FE|nr:phage antirepressor KilAC domain-containing protein [Faecalicoccus acidiformans]MDM8204304.1 phage antirepressor KilAC domain-containing protein [Faecalicoccus acidiformans]